MNDEQFDYLIKLLTKQNKMLGSIGWGVTFFVFLTIIYMILQTVNFFLSF